MDLDFECGEFKRQLEVSGCHPEQQYAGGGTVCSQVGDVHGSLGNIYDRHVAQIHFAGFQHLGQELQMMFRQKSVICRADQQANVAPVGTQYSDTGGGCRLLGFMLAGPWNHNQVIGKKTMEYRSRQFQIVYTHIENVLVFGCRRAQGFTAGADDATCRWVDKLTNVSIFAAAFFEVPDNVCFFIVQK